MYTIKSFTEYLKLSFNNWKTFPRLKPLKTYLKTLKIFFWKHTWLPTFILPVSTELVLINKNKLFKTNLSSARVFTFLNPFSKTWLHLIPRNYNWRKKDVKYLENSRWIRFETSHTKEKDAFIKILVEIENKISCIKGVPQFAQSWTIFLHANFSSDIFGI